MEISAPKFGKPAFLPFLVQFGPQMTDDVVAERIILASLKRLGMEDSSRLFELSSAHS
jgi:hypothetical protein